MTQYMVQKSSGSEWLVLSVGILLVLGSALQRFPVSIGGANVYVPHLIAVALFPLFFYSDALTGSVRLALITFMAISIVVVLPALLLPSASVRLSFLLQIVLNACTMVVSYALFRQLSLQGLRRLIVICGSVLVGAALIQLVFAPGMNARGETTLGLPHPILFFSEETWLAIFASLLSVAALGVGARRTGFLLIILVFFIGTRSAMIISACGLLMTFHSVANRKWLRALVVLVPVAFSIWFLVDAVFATGNRIFNDSLDTRTSDISAVRQANNDRFFPFGGDILSVFDFSRFRQVPATSNVQGFELIWKFGLGGVVILTAFTALITWVLPRLVLLDQHKPVWPVWAALMVWPAMLQFNNSFGYPWMWVLLAMCLAVLAHGGFTAENLPVDGPSRNMIRPKRTSVYGYGLSTAVESARRDYRSNS